MAGGIPPLPPWQHAPTDPLGWANQTAIATASPFAPPPASWPSAAPACASASTTDPPFPTWAASSFYSNPSTSVAAGASFPPDSTAFSYGQFSAFSTNWAAPDRASAFPGHALPNQGLSVGTSPDWAPVNQPSSNWASSNCPSTFPVQPMAFIPTGYSVDGLHNQAHNPPAFAGSSYADPPETRAPWQTQHSATASQAEGLSLDDNLPAPGKNPVGSIFECGRGKTD
jgi:hypothetical protein